jgi:hypothetical protein
MAPTPLLRGRLDEPDEPEAVLLGEQLELIQALDDLFPARADQAPGFDQPPETLGQIGGVCHRMNVRHFGGDV